MPTNSEWHCLNDQCYRVLGVVQGNELVICEDITGKNIHTKGPNLVIVCPACGSKKTWYTSDLLTRALYQFIDAMVSVLTAKTVRELGEKIERIND